MPRSSDLSIAILRSAFLAGTAGLCLALAGCGGPAKKPAAPAGSDVAASGPQASGPNTGVAGPAAPTSATPGTATPVAMQVDTSSWLLQPPFYAAGDEPFWRLDLADGWFVFKRSGLPEIEAQITPPKREKGFDVFAAAPLIVRIKREACETDGGGKGDASAVVTFDGVDFEGCAFTGAEAATSPEAGAVADAIGSIDACLAKLAEPALVTGVYPREGGRTAVALRKKDGSRFECAAEPGGKDIAFLDPIEPGSEQPYQTRMRFLRQGVEAPECKDAEDVRGGDAVLGKLLTKKCKF